MRKRVKRIHWTFALVASALSGGTLLCQSPAYASTSPRSQFVEVEQNVRLEVLDWGGSGRAIVLLAGLGDTAHIYERLAPRLSKMYRVLGITRRGFGASSKPQEGYSADRLADDVLRVLDALKLERPILAGHSVAGEELSSIGARKSDRIGALIYMDAAWDRTSIPSNQKKAAATGDDFDKVGIAEQPKLDPKRFDPMASVRAGVQKPDYARITVPALALYAAPRTWKEMMPDAPDFEDEGKRQAAENVVKQMAIKREHMAREFRTSVSQSSVIEIQGAGHYLFETHEDETVREILAFLKRLKF